jgi:hypothetical protein
VSTTSAADEGQLGRPPSEWLEAVVEAERRGEVLSAFDLAEQGLGEHPGEVALQYKAALALARADSTEQALRHLDHLRSAVSEVAELIVQHEQAIRLLSDALMTGDEMSGEACEPFLQGVSPHEGTT